MNEPEDISKLSREELVQRFGPIAGIHHDVSGLATELHRAGIDPHSRTTNFLQFSLKKYIDHADMHETFAAKAHQEGRHAEARSHLDEMRHALRAVHQVVHYQRGKDSDVTKAVRDRMQQIDDSINMYQWETQLDEDR